MLVIGLTGGIASGKSTVAQLFADLNVPLIDADVIARELTQPGQKPLLAILNHFKENLLLEDQNLNRARLREIIFAHPEEREWLEALLHPLIFSEMKSRMEKITAPYCILIIPLLFEVESQTMIDRTLVVDASLEAQIERVVLRDKIPLSQAKSILQTQISRAQRIAKADDVITNDKDIAHLKSQVSKLHEQYLKLSKKK